MAAPTVSRRAAGGRSSNLAGENAAFSEVRPRFSLGGQVSSPLHTTSNSNLAAAATATTTSFGAEDAMAAAVIRTRSTSSIYDGAGDEFGVSMGGGMGGKSLVQFQSGQSQKCFFY
jgi:hypothetical protein